MNEIFIVLTFKNGEKIEEIIFFVQFSEMTSQAEETGDSCMSLTGPDIGGNIYFFVFMIFPLLFVIHLMKSADYINDN